MYVVAGEKATGRRSIGRVFPNFADPTYIKKSFEGILMYELAGDYINKYYNYADPNERVENWIYT